MSGTERSRRPRTEVYISTSENVEPNAIEKTATAVSVLLAILTFPLSAFVCLIIMSEYERAIIFRLGRLRKGGARGPGILFILPCIDDWVRTDLRTISYNVPAQEVLTRDSVTIQLDAVVYYRINNPLLAVIQVDNVHYATNLLAQATLRNVAGTKFISELLAEKDTVSTAIASLLDAATDPWGVKVERVEIKDVRLPVLLQRAMAAEAEAAREAKAKIVAAEGELNASRALKEASDVMSLNPVALQLRYLQTLNNISGDQNHNIIFPFPVNLFKKLLGPSNGKNGSHNGSGASSSKAKLSIKKDSVTTVDNVLDEALQQMDSEQFFDLEDVSSIFEDIIKQTGRRS